MAVRRKISPAQGEFIDKGAPVKNDKIQSFKNVQVAIPNDLLELLNAELARTPWCSRNQWIVQAVYDRLKNIKHE